MTETRVTDPLDEDEAMPEWMVEEQQAIEDAIRQIGREIYDHLASAGWTYDSTQLNSEPIEHRWRQGDATIYMRAGCLSYARGDYRMICDLPVTPQQAADILAALGIVPVDVTTGWRVAAERHEELAADLYDAEAEVERLTQAVERLRMAYGLARRRADRWRRRAGGEIGWRYDRDDEPTGELPDGVEGRPVGRGVAR